MPLVLTLLSIVLSYYSPGDLNPDLAPYHIQALLVPAAAIATLVAWNMRRNSLQSPQWVLVIGLWFAVVASLLIRGWLRSSLESFLAFGLIVCIYYLVSINGFTLTRVGIICTVVALCGVVMAALAIVSYHTGFMSDRLLLEAHAPVFHYRIRGFGILNDPNDLAEFLVVCMALLGLGWNPKSPIGCFLLVILPGALLTYALYLTESRGAFFGIAAMVFVVMAPRLGKIPSAVMVVAIFGIMLLAQFGGGREISLHESNAGGRITAWGVGVAELKHDPLFGIGYGQFTENNDLTAHNSFVLCFAELGLFGYFFWLAVVVTSVMGLGALTRLPRKTEEDIRFARYVTAIRAALYGFLATAWFLSRTYTETLFILFALSAALIHLKRDYPEMRFSLARWLPATIAWQIVSIVIVYLTIRARSF